MVRLLNKRARGSCCASHTGTTRQINDYARQPVITHASEQEPLLAIVLRRKLYWFGHVTRHNPLSDEDRTPVNCGGRTTQRPED